MGKARKDCREGASRTVDPQGQAAMRSGKYGTKETVRERRLRERSTGVSMERRRKAVSKRVTEGEYYKKTLLQGYAMLTMVKGRWETWHLQEEN